MKYYFFEWCNGEIMDYKEFETMLELKSYLNNNNVYDFNVYYGFDITDDL